MKSWQTMTWFVLVLSLVCLVSLFVHELGHGLTAVALGGKFDALYTWPGFQVWPEFGRSYPGEWTGHIGIADLEFGQYRGVDSWQHGLILLMGSGSNLLLAVLSLIGLWVIRPRAALRMFLIAGSLLFIDLALYTFLPLLGLQHFVFFGGSSPEPLVGAVQMGIPGWIFRTGVGLTSLGMIAGLIAYLRENPVGNDN